MDESEQLRERSYFMDLYSRYLDVGIDYHFGYLTPLSRTFSLMAFGCTRWNPDKSILLCWEIPFSYPAVELQIWACSQKCRLSKRLFC